MKDQQNFTMTELVDYQKRFLVETKVQRKERIVTQLIAGRLAVGEIGINDFINDPEYLNKFFRVANMIINNIDEGY